MVLDCRTELDLEAGVYPNTALLDPNSYRDKRLLLEMTDKFEGIKGVYHICLLGSRSARYLHSDLISNSNNFQIDSCKHMIDNLVQLFTALEFPYISVVDGGYERCHEIAMYNNLNITHHSSSFCIVCSPNGPNNASIVKSKFSKLKKSMLGKIKGLTCNLKGIGKSISLLEPSRNKTPMKKAKVMKLDPNSRYFLCKIIDRIAGENSSDEFSLSVNESNINLGIIIDRDPLTIVKLVESFKIETLLKLSSTPNLENSLSFHFMNSKKPLSIVMISENDVNCCVELIYKYLNPLQLNE